ncbi:MAG TPA: enoyl-CoA hydratase-related protein [Phenylobacterium sp.]|nr:enoyl-CoA hydratase-related protein [Phenylobacterium sp.]
MAIFGGGAFDTLVCDRPAPGVARIVLNRPQAMNAYTFAMCGELRAAIQAFADDDEVRALILTGAGTRAFCTGGDISGGDAAHSRSVASQPMGQGREMRDGMQAVVLALRRLDKPSLAMIRGYAVAGGLALALGCDMRFAGASAKLGDTATKVGLLPDEGGAWLFPRAMGLDRALKMSLLNEIYDAPTAMGLGLVTEVVDDEGLEARCLEVAQALAAKAPLAVRLTKMMMSKGLETGLESSLVDAQVAVMVTNPSEDVREGIAAFREKRAPAFKGR